MTTIYKIANQLNGKIYVGQTRQPIEKRFLQHAKANSPLGNAMRNCGLENFTLEVLEMCETQLQANERERFWIKVLKCKLPNGYNQRDGGNGSVRFHRKTIPSSETTTLCERLKLLRQNLGLNQTDFGRKIGIGAQAIGEIEKGRNELTTRNFDAICREFNVNPEWLRNGTGEPFLPPKVETFLDKVVAEKNLSEEDRALIESILELPPEAREAVVAWAENLVAKTRAKEEKQAQSDERRELEKQLADIQKRLAELDALTSRKPDSSLTKEEAMALVGREWDEKEAARKRGTTTSSASIGLSGSSSKRFSGSS